MTAFPLGQIRKTVASVVGAAIVWAGVVVDSPSKPITAHEWILAAILGATALGVYGLTNDGPIAQEAAEVATPTGAMNAVSAKADPFVGDASQVVPPPA